MANSYFALLSVLFLICLYSLLLILAVQIWQENTNRHNMYKNLFIRVQRYKYYNQKANKNIISHSLKNLKWSGITSIYNVLLVGNRLLCIGKGLQVVGIYP